MDVNHPVCRLNNANCLDSCPHSLTLPPVLRAVCQEEHWNSTLPAAPSDTGVRAVTKGILWRVIGGKPFDDVEAVAVSILPLSGRL